MRSCVVAAVLCVTTAAFGDGAFPDGAQIHVPADQPGRIVLGANFGIVVSDDDGATWHFICERVILDLAGFYQMGPAPDRALYAVSYDGLASSHDRGCTWEKARGPFISASDVFPDPTDPARVFAVGLPRPPDGGFTPSTVFESRDGGRSFGPGLLTAARGQAFTGVEVARSNPQTVYLTQHPNPVVVLRSDDGGARFTAFAHPELGRVVPGIMAVDATNHRKLYLRLTDTNEDFVGVSEDGGETVSIRHSVIGNFSVFLQRANGTILLGTYTVSKAFRSFDGGMTFEGWAPPMRFRALAERDGALYAAADDRADGFAVAKSVDDGETWTPLLRFRDIRGPDPACAGLTSRCAQAWYDLQVSVGLAPSVPPMRPPIMESSPACGCFLGQRPRLALLPMIIVVAVLLCVRGASRRRRSPRVRSGS